MFAKTLPLSFLILSACIQSVAQSPAIQEVDQAQNLSDIVRFSEECEKWDDWDKPAEPFKIHGNTYYVGTCGIAAILILNNDSHVLIDTGTNTGADVVLANIAKLGFDLRDVSILLSSHEHFDHVGGVAKVQEATGAIPVSSEIAIAVMSSGITHPDDPQADMHEPMEPIAQGTPYQSPAIQEFLEALGIVPIETPGHSPGAMSWQWESCDGETCKTIAYADSMSPVSRDDYKFSDHPDYVAAYRAGIARVRALDCDILLTPHPSHSRMIERAATGTLEGGVTCEEYADGKTRDLNARLEREAGATQ